MGTELNSVNSIHTYTLQICSIMKLVYWQIPGRAHVTRAILHYHEQPFEDVHQKKENWAVDKEALKTKILYPNLPYIVDGLIHMSESLAIAKYVARKCNCVLTDTNELAIQDQFEGFVSDLHSSHAKARYLPEGEAREKALAEWKAGIAEKMAPIEKHLSDRKWIAGEKLSWVDFHLYAFFAGASSVSPDMKTNLPNVNKHTEQLLEKESLKKFHESTNMKVMPFDY